MRPTNNRQFHAARKKEKRNKEGQTFVPNAIDRLVAQIASSIMNDFLLLLWLLLFNLIVKSYHIIPRLQDESEFVMSSVELSSRSEASWVVAQVEVDALNALVSRPDDSFTVRS